MSSDQRYRFVIPLVVILVVLNIGSLGFLWYGHLNNRPPKPEGDGKPNPEEFLIQQLQLNTEQAQIFRTLRAQHMRETDSLRREIQHLKVHLMEGLFMIPPDTVHARVLSDTIGKLQADFELSVYRHFSDLKQICQTEQHSKLKRLIFEALNKADQAQPPQQEPRRGDDKPPQDNRPRPPAGGG